MMRTEADDAYKELTKGNGFAVLRGLLAPSEADAAREIILGQVDEAAHDDDGIMRLSNLLVLDPLFEKLVTHSRLLALVHKVLGTDARLSAVGGRILMPNCSLGGLHVDYPYWAMDPGMPVEPALMLQVIWMMEPFTEDNGGTWVAPGSQAWGDYPVESRFAKAGVQATGDAGDAVVSHGLLWHRTAVNRSPQPRVALLINYSQLAIQPMTELGPFSDAFAKGASDELRALLGFERGKSLRRRVMQVTDVS